MRLVPPYQGPWASAPDPSPSNMGSQRLLKPLSKDSASTCSSLLGEGLRRLDSKRQREVRSGRSQASTQSSSQRGGGISRHVSQRPRRRPARQGVAEVSQSRPQAQPPGPLTHQRRRRYRSNQDSQHHASYGHYGTSPAYADTGRYHYQHRQDTNAGGPSTWASPSSSLAPNGMFQSVPTPQTSFFGQTGGMPDNYESFIPSTPLRNLEYPTVLPPDHQNDLAMVGPNGERHHFPTKIEMNYTHSFITMRAAGQLGCRLEVCPPVPLSGGGLDMPITPAYYVHNVRINSSFLKVRMFLVGILYVLPDNNSGISVIIGKNLMDRIEQWHRSSAQPPAVNRHPCKFALPQLRAKNSTKCNKVSAMDESFSSSQPSNVQLPPSFYNNKA